VEAKGPAPYSSSELRRQPETATAYRYATHSSLAVCAPLEDIPSRASAVLVERHRLVVHVSTSRSSRIRRAATSTRPCLPQACAPLQSVAQVPCTVVRALTRFRTPTAQPSRPSHHSRACLPGSCHAATPTSASRRISPLPASLVSFQPGVLAGSSPFRACPDRGRLRLSALAAPLAISHAGPTIHLKIR
jgi:hypothetical protein